MILNQASLLFFGSALLSLSISLFAFRQKNNRSAAILALLMLTITIWTFLYGLELTMTQLWQMKLILGPQYISIALTPVLWFIFTIHYSGIEGRINQKYYLWLLIIPALTVIFAVSNDYHHLFYQSVTLGLAENGLPFQKLKPAPLWWLHTAYSYLLISAGVIIMVWMLFRVSQIHRKQVLLFLAAASLPFITSIAYIFDLLKPYGFLDMTPLAFILTVAIFIYGILKAELFSITPLALDVLFKHIPDAIFVLNNDSRIISTNPAAYKLLTITEKNQNEEVTIQHRFNAENNHKNELRFQDRIYDMSRTPLKTPQGRELGTLLILRDITERKQKYEELQSAMEQIKTLQGIVPICASCKNIRDDDGHWQKVETYMSLFTDAKFTHGICPDCMEKLYPELAGDLKLEIPDKEKKDAE